MPISVIFEGLEYGLSIEEIIGNYNVTREQIQAVLEFAARSAAPPVSDDTANMSDARPLR
jgi:uncharacterized protein (DUF433 family)